MNDQAFCAQCGAGRPAGAEFCPRCGRPYASTDGRPVTSPSNNVATAAAIAWLISAALTGYLAYQQWTVYQALELAGMDPGEWGATAAWNAFSCLVTLYFGARILLSPSRSLLTWSVVWAAITVVGGVAQFGSGVGDIFALAVISAGIAGVLSYVGRSSVAEPPSPGRPTSSAQSGTPPAATPSPADTKVAIDPMPSAEAAPLVVGSRPPVSEPLAAPPAAQALSTAPATQRTSPVLIVGVVLSGLLALGVLGFAVLSGPGSSLLGGVSATPSPVVTPRPTPRPTPTFSGTGEIVFGLEYDPDSLLIAEPRSRFRTTYHPIAWSASLTGPVGTTTLELTLARRTTAGVETPLHEETVSISNTQADLLAAESDLGALVGGQAGTYVMRLIRADRVLAEGTFALVP